MQEHGSQYKFLGLLKACAQQKDLERGRRLHAEIAAQGADKDAYIGSYLVNLYVKCGFLAKAQEVFDQLLARNLVSWSALISGYANHGCAKAALDCFGRMRRERVAPDAVIFVCVLKACACIGAENKGQEIHNEAVKLGLIEKDAFLGGSLVDMYAKCGSLAEAQEVFDNLLVRDRVSWNALIAGYAQQGHSEEALNCFERMLVMGVSPDAVTFVCVLKACGNAGAAAKGRAIHAEIARTGLLEKNAFVGCSLVDMYAKCGSIEKAQKVFDILPVRNVVSWSALIAGYAQHGCAYEALNCFESMQLEGVPPNAATFVCSLKACGCAGAIDKGQEIHAEIGRKGLLKSNVVIASALVDMYGKCGALAKAQEVFDKLPLRNLVSWNAIIAGYGQFGSTEDVFCIFDRMFGEKVEPDLITFNIVLNACSHSGLLEKGQMYFESMINAYGLTPTLEHHICIIDLLGRAGQLEKAITMIQKMPFHTNLVTWHILLGACRKWGDVELGRQAFEHALQLDEEDASIYVCMSNIYLNAGMQEDADKIDIMRVKKQAWMKPGRLLGCRTENAESMSLKS